jgi:two-component system sensor histidine kinase/response regulator
VLVVEDNELNQEVARELLTGAGLVVDVAQDGQVALAKVQESRYDLVFMDMQMPVMDGLAATEAIRRLPELAGLPIVAMTANAMQRDQERCLQAGMNDYIAKPIEPEALWAVLRRWIKPRAAAVAAPAPAPAASPGTALPADIAGLDVGAGLRRVLGKTTMYLSLLRRFAAGQKDAAGDILAALDRGELAEAQRRAHTVKGLAGTLGAAALQVAAADLERAIKESAPRAQVDERLQDFSLSLAALLTELEAKLPPEDAAAPVQAVDRQALAVACSQLAKLLAEDDAAALHLFSLHEPLLEAAFPEEFHAIRNAVRSFDFATAKTALNQACRRIDIKAGDEKTTPASSP